MCGNSPLFSQLENTHQKGTFEDLVSLLKNFSVGQINSYLGFLLGYSPTIQYPLYVGDMYYGGDLLRLEASKIWDTKYASSIPAMLAPLKNHCVINVDTINHIARNVFIERHDIKMDRVFHYILNMVYDTPESVARFKREICDSEPTERQWELISGSFGDIFWPINDDIRELKISLDDPFTFQNRCGNRIEEVLSSIMNGTNSEGDSPVINVYEDINKVINKDAYRRFVRMIISEFVMAVCGLSYLNDGANYYAIHSVLQNSIPANFKLDKTDYALFTKNLSSCCNLWNLK